MPSSNSSMLKEEPFLKSFAIYPFIPLNVSFLRSIVVTLSLRVFIIRIFSMSTYEWFFIVTKLSSSVPPIIFLPKYNAVDF
jgi:hypothetical protein